MSVSEFYDCTPRDTYNFIRAGQERQEFEIEQQYDYTRNIMWASLAAMGGKDFHTKPSDIIRLKRDGPKVTLSPYDIQELKSWDERMDEEMRVQGLIE